MALPFKEEFLSLLQLLHCHCLTRPLLPRSHSRPLARIQEDSHQLAIPGLGVGVGLGVNPNPNPKRWLKPLTTEVARHLLIPVAYAPVIIVPPKCRT